MQYALNYSATRFLYTESQKFLSVLVDSVLICEGHLKFTKKSGD